MTSIPVEFYQPENTITYLIATTIHLTRRQRQVLELITQGKTNKEIALALDISERTVKYHVGQVLERFQLQNRYELRDYAKDQGLL